MFESFGRTILEAAASGGLTIAHPKHQPVFGDAIDYALPGQAQALIAGYVADPTAYAARVARTRDLVRERFGRQGFIKRLADLETDACPAGEDQGMDGPTTGGSTPTARGSMSDGPWVARTERLRSAADAGRTDQLTVVHAAGAEQGVASWWGEWAAAHPGDDLPGALLGSAPQEVAALVTRRDHLVHVARRAGAHALEGVLTAATQHPAVGIGGHVESQGARESALRHAGITVPQGWSAVAWWEPRIIPSRAVLPPVP